jgi:hypothetical protein
MVAACGRGARPTPVQPPRRERWSRALSQRGRWRGSAQAGDSWPARVRRAAWRPRRGRAAGPGGGAPRVVSTRGLPRQRPGGERTVFKCKPTRVPEASAWTPHAVQLQPGLGRRGGAQPGLREARDARPLPALARARPARVPVRVPRERARDPLSYGRRARQPATKRRAASRFASTATTTRPHKGCRATAETATRKRRTSRPKPIR